MTGFCRVDGVFEDWSYAVEARSVNGRTLEVRFRAPPGMDRLERLARELAQARLQRGQVSVALQVRRVRESASVRIDEGLLRRYAALARSLTDSGMASPPSADGLLALKGVIDVEEDEEAHDRERLDAALGKALADALDGLRDARRAEGAALAPALFGHVERIRSLAAMARGESQAQTVAIRDRFARRLAELGADLSSMEERLAQETAALAVRADVREELDRLEAHCGAAQLLLEQVGAGRKLDFLAQEFMREANTLCSKSATIALTSLGLELKAAIEQLREQVQNVE